MRGLADDSLPQAAWQEYGGLLTSLRNVHDSLAKVTEWSHGAQPGHGAASATRSHRASAAPGLTPAVCQRTLGVRERE